MTNRVIYCPHLGRNIRGILNAVPHPHIYTGQQTPKGEDGCLQSHQAIVREAKDADLPCVAVYEDDCEFTWHFHYEKWCQDAEWAQANGYDVLVGGCVQTYEPKLVRGDMVAVSAFHSAHCVVYFESGYDKIAQTAQPYDVSIGQVGCKVVMTYPFVAVQRATFSGILQHDVNYVPLYQQYEEHLGRALGLRR